MVGRLKDKENEEGDEEEEAVEEHYESDLINWMSLKSNKKEYDFISQPFVCTCLCVFYLKVE